MKLKEFITKHKRAIVNSLLLIVSMVILGGITLFVLWLAKVINIDNSGLSLNIGVFNQIKGEWWFIALFIVIQVLITTFLSFVPATSMLFIIGATQLFGTDWKCFLICFSCVVLSSLFMDLLGRLGGSKLVKKLIGDDEYESAYQLVREKGVVYVPFMYLLPLFPDDAICMVCGTMKMNWFIHTLYIVLCRGIGCATIVFGINLIPYQTFTTFYEWFVLGAVLIVYLFILFKIARFIDKKVSAIIKSKEAHEKQDIEK